MQDYTSCIHVGCNLKPVLLQLSCQPLLYHLPQLLVMRCARLFLIQRARKYSQSLSERKWLVFYIPNFFFVFSAFSRQIFAIKILNARISYYFYANFALLPSTFVQPSFLLNFLASSSFVVYITMFPLGKVCATRNLMVVILFSTRQASILYAISLGAYFFISSAAVLSLSLTSISLFLLQRRRRVFALAAIATQVCGLGEAIVATCCSFKSVNLMFIPFCCQNCSFAKDFMLSSFCHICAGIGPRRVASTYSILMCIIFSTYSMGILLLVLIFSCMDFRYSTVKAPCSVIFVYWVPLEGQFAAMVA